MRRHVRAGRVDHRTEVAERKFVRELPRVVGVEGSPPAVRGLHAEQPVDASVDRRHQPPAVRDVGPAQSHQHLGRVVDVRIVVVCEFERPPARVDVGPARRPIAADSDLFVQQPLRRPLQDRIVSVQARVGERDHRQGRVPHRRLAGLEPASGPVGDGEALKALEASLHDRVVERVAERVEGRDRPHPGRLDAAPRAVRLLSMDDPFGGAPARLPAQAPVGMAFVCVQQFVDPFEPALPRRERMSRLPGETALDLIERDAERMHRPERSHDREGDDGLPRPAGPVVHIEREPGREEDQLGREGRQLVPRPDAEQRQPQPGEHASAFDPSTVEDELPRGAHVRCVRRIAGQSKGRVGLDRGREVPGPPVEIRPRAVVALLRADPGRGRDEFVVAQHVEELPEEQVLGVHGHVGFELALPPPSLVLQGDQVVASSNERLLGGALDSGANPNGHQKSLCTTNWAISRRSRTDPEASPSPSSSSSAARRCSSASCCVHARLPPSSRRATARLVSRLNMRPPLAKRQIAKRWCR